MNTETDADENFHSKDDFLFVFFTEIFTHIHRKARTIDKLWRWTYITVSRGEEILNSRFSQGSHNYPRFNFSDHSEFHRKAKLLINKDEQLGNEEEKVNCE